jgi:NAD-dependent deacetylase
MESGIPTFRGKEGYWTIGSKEYHPQEMATYAMFSRKPLEVWEWYCYRRSVCANAQPNEGHKAIVKLEEILGNRFTLITQNVDGLHLRAGNNLERTFQIHGNINYMRCSEECTDELYPIPDFIPTSPIAKEFPRELLEKLRCPKCNQYTRPHVLWFDETYDEKFFKFESSIMVAGQTDVLLIVGTSGATTLPNHIVNLVIQKGGLVFDVNIESNLFGNIAEKNKGYSFQGPSGTILPMLVKNFKR